MVLTRGARRLNDDTRMMTRGPDHMLMTTSAMLRRHLFILKLGVAPLALGAALFATPVVAQETTGIIQGQVLTSAGTPAVGAAVEVTHVPTGTRSVVTTNQDGRFNAPNLRPG